MEAINLNSKELDLLLNKIANGQMNWHNDGYENHKKFFFLDEKILIFPSVRYGKITKHNHPYIEMIYVYSGFLKLTINNQDVILDEGDICIIDSNINHFYESLGEEDMIINILIKKSFFDINFLSLLYNNKLFSNFLVNEMNDKKIQHYLVFHSENSTIIREIMTKLLCEYYDKKIGYETVIRANILLLFTELLRIRNSSHEKDVLGQNNNSIISQINEYLKEHYHDATLKQIAEQLNYHPVYLSDLIKQKTGKNFKDILQEYRLNNACKLLKNTDLSVLDIINKVGYCNASYFYKIFRKHYHLTPFAYRDKANRNKE